MAFRSHENAVQILTSCSPRSARPGHRGGCNSERSKFRSIQVPARSSSSTSTPPWVWSSFWSRSPASTAYFSLKSFVECPTGWPKDPADTVPKRDELRPDTGWADRVAPTAVLDVADHGQRPPLRVREQSLRQARDERLVGDRDRSLAPVGQEVVERRGPGAIAGEQEGYQSMDSSRIGDVRRTEVIARPDRAEPGPILYSSAPVELPWFGCPWAPIPRRRRKERGAARIRRRVQDLGQPGPGCVLPR